MCSARNPWRRYREETGPHIPEKRCHDLDLLNWFCASLPQKVFAFAGNDFFIPSNQVLQEKYGAEAFRLWADAAVVDSPFTSDSDVEDTSVAVLQYRDGIKVTFQATMSNVMPERRMYFSCTEGTMRLELYTGRLEYRSLGADGITAIDAAGGGHGNGDDYIMKERCDTMRNGSVPACSGDEGLESAVVALSIDRAAREGTVLDLQPVCKSPGR